MSSKTRSKRRRVAKESPTETEAMAKEEEKRGEPPPPVLPVVPASSFGETDADIRWDEIGEYEESYLSSTSRELYELLIEEDTLEKLKEKDIWERFELMNSLLKYSWEKVEEMQWEYEEEAEASLKERSRTGKFISLVHFQLKRMIWMFRETRRGTRAVIESGATTLREMELKHTARMEMAEHYAGEREKELDSMRKEIGTLREKVETMTRERGELLSKLDSRRKERRDAFAWTEAEDPVREKVDKGCDAWRVECRDVSVLTEAEVPDTEMVVEKRVDERRGRQDLPPPVEMSRGWRSALESLVEEKVLETLTSVGVPVPLERRTGGGRPPPGDGEGQPSRGMTTWAKVVGRRKGKGKPPSSGDNTLPRRRMDRAARGGLPPVEKTTEERGEPSGARRGRKRRDREWPVLPRTAAVVLSAPAGRETACDELLRRAKEVISIREMGLPQLEIRRARTGGLILGVPGQRPGEGADRLAAGLSGLADEMGVRVTRPIKKADIRVSGIEVSSMEEDVIAAIATATGCNREGIKSGRIRRGPAGVGSLWLQCPVEVAVQMARAGSVEVGWSRASVVMLRDRPLRCFRCLEVGHVSAQCASEVDRSTRCYRCGTIGHRVVSCEERAPRCPLCVDKGRPHDHVLGGMGCCNDTPPRTRRGSGGGGGAAAQDGRAASASTG